MEKKEEQCKVICAWCKKTMRPGNEKELPSHGICPACRDKFMGEAKNLVCGVEQPVAR